MKNSSYFKKKRLLVSLAFIAVISMAVFFFHETFDLVFLSMLRLSIACFEQDLATYGILTLVMQLIAWIIFIISFYYTVFNMFFPRIRSINNMGAKNILARKVMWMKSDEQYIYAKVKFTLFPLFKWYTMRIPTPNQAGVKWTRMPSFLDISSEEIDMGWDPANHMYYITGNPLKRIDDDINVYRGKSRDVIKHVGEYVGDAIHGDSDMMKDYYTMSLVMDENKDLVPKSMLKKPPTGIEKEVEDE
jgi:hypothetical protein